MSLKFICEAHGSLEVEAPCYKPEGSGFEIQWGSWVLSIDLTLLATLGPGVYSASIRNEYQRQIKMFLVCRTRPLREAYNVIAICVPIVNLTAAFEPVV
jgi:hypothetical protein